MTTDTFASSAAPTYAIKIWADDNNLYAEVPSIHSPCICKFPITEGGLAKALAVMGAKHQVEGHGEPYIHRPALNKKLMAAGVTQKDMDVAEAVLRKTGFLK